MTITKLICFYLLFCSSLINAQEHIVHLKTMGTNGKMMVFEPILSKISVGDTVNFIPSDASHNAESFSVPTEKSTFKTPYGKATKITFNEEGIVLVKCLPHFSLGMIGIIVIGENVDKKKAVSDWQTIRAGVAINKEVIDQALAQIK
ncbi:MAG: plastocyanin/azurin family copper-binding protein [Colwellia sp.]|nr:plastocyanin/azurin family copper-binding protein [Colwellia sp.]